jgi:hypothetical protein
MREFTLTTRIMGELHIVVLFSDDGVWTDHEGLQRLIGDAASYFGHVDEGVYNHAKAGYTDQLVKALGVPPVVALRRITPEVGRCHFYSGCPGASLACQFGSGAVPECFMADGPDSVVRAQLHRMAWAMIEGAYVVIVRRGVGVV